MDKTAPNNLTEEKLALQKIINNLENENRSLKESNSKLNQKIDELNASLTNSTKTDEIFQSLFSNMSDGVALYDIIYDTDKKIKNLLIFNANPSYFKMSGMKKENLIGQPFSHIFEENGTSYIKSFLKVAETKKVKSFEAYFPTEQSYYKINVFPVNDHKLAAIYTDISKLKKAEDKILFERSLFQTLLDKFPDAIYFKDREAKFIRASLSLTQLFNTTPNEIIGKSDYDFHVKELADLKYKDDLQIIESGMPLINKVEKDQTISGKIRWVSSTKLPLFDKFGKIIGIFGISRDITEKKEAEEKEIEYKNNLITLSQTAIQFLQKKDVESIFSFICQKLSDHIANSIIFYSIANISCDPNIYKCTETDDVQINYLLSLLNQENRKEYLLGKEKLRKLVMSGKLTLLKNNLNDLIEEKESLKVINEISRTLKISGTYLIGLTQDSSILGVFIILIRKNGEIKDPNFIETYLSQAAIAIHRKQLEIELIRAKEKAEESDNLKTAFLANLSHEIRTPVTGIQGFAELLTLDDIEEEKRLEYVKIINEKSDQLIQIISDIIDISKIEARQITIEPFVDSLNQQLRKLLKKYQQKIQESNKKLNIHLIDSLPDKQSLIYMDTFRLNQVLSCFLDNALKFTKQGNIEFGYQKKNENTLLFFIKDTGIGIPVNKREVIFERFRQIDNSNTRRYGGTGLGLSIAKCLVELMGGKIWVENAYFDDFEHKDLLNPEIETSKETIGSIFYFTMPYNPDVPKIETNVENTTETVDEENDWSTKTILIVEDDQINYQFIKATLDFTGANIIHCEDGESAVFECEKNKTIDLILMDIQLPVLNGYEATEKIRLFDEKTPIIAQTAFAMQEDLDKSIHAGCNDYITKPYSMDKLLSIIAKYIEKKN